MIAVCLSWMMSFPAKRNIFVELMSTPFFYKCIRQIRTKMKPKVLTSIKKEKRKVQTLVQLYIEWTYCCPACFNLQSKQQILIWMLLYLFFYSQVGAAHCFSQGDDPSRYTITCGEHSLQKQDTYQVTLQVIPMLF